ncbi:MAG TPA: hypothetical protein VHB77_20055, partial [Planctomycetaceae bacterium]|nr:hypothetical protein [Planctomycetaceae bacterium]
MLEFQAWNQSGAWPVTLCVAAGAAALLIVLLYRDEQRLVPRPVGLALLGLRVLAVATLFFVLLQPAFTWRLDEQRQGRIVVAVDASESMTTSDTHASRGERLRWARGLGMIGNATTEARLNRWQSDLDADREPEWVEPREAADPEQRARLAKSRREALDAVLDDVAKLPRREIARRLLLQTGHPLLEGLDRLGRVQLLVFGGKAEATDPATLEKTLDDPPASLQPQKTDLSQPLALASTAEDASPLRAVILLTDGRDTAGRDAAGLAARFGQVQAPVFPILIGSKLKPRDISIASVDYPETVYKDDHPLIKVVVSAYGFDGQELQVFLERERDETVEKTGRVEDSTLTLEFPIDASKVGRQQFTVRTDVKKGESRDDNNSSTFGLSVVDDKLHVLLVEGEARWEFRFLDNAFRRDDRVDVKEVLFTQPFLGLN